MSVSEGCIAVCDQCQVLWFANLLEFESHIVVLFGESQALICRRMEVIALLGLIVACRCGLLCVAGHCSAPTKPLSMVRSFSVTGWSVLEMSSKDIWAFALSSSWCVAAHSGAG